MAARGSIAAGSLSARLHDYLAEHGPSRARDVAAGLHAPDHMTANAWRQKVNNVLNKMVARGAVVRERTHVPESTIEVSLYSLPPKD